MSAWFEQMLSILLTVLGIASTTDAAALGLAIAIVAVVALTIAMALSLRPAHGGSTPHPLRAIDASTLLTQSDPDAAGHPRPRAPGAVPAA